MATTPTSTPASKPVVRRSAKLPPQPAAEPAHGRIQRVYPERGFGFIRCTEGAADDVGQDFFFHHSGLDDCVIEELLEGTPVVFTPTYVPKGKRAEHVQLTEA